MKKTFISIAMFAMPTFAATADNYGYLTFETNSGAQTSYAVSNLKMKVVDGNLVVTSAQETATLPLDALSKMFFSATSGIGNNTSAANTPVRIYSLSGVCLGSYRNLETAKRALSKGIYVVKTTGKTIKITVK